MHDRGGNEWDSGARVQVMNWVEMPPQVREGTIIERFPGRERGTFLFRLRLDGLPGEWVFGPDELMPPGGSPA